MNIIEREINKREALIQERNNKLAEAEELLARYEPISVETLTAEINELKTYLPVENTEGQL